MPPAQCSSHYYPQTRPSTRQVPLHRARRCREVSVSRRGTTLGPPPFMLLKTMNPLRYPLRFPLRNRQALKGRWCVILPVHSQSQSQPHTLRHHTLYRYRYRYCVSIPQILLFSAHLVFVFVLHLLGCLSVCETSVPVPSQALVAPVRTAPLPQHYHPQTTQDTLAALPVVTGHTRTNFNQPKPARC